MSTNPTLASFLSQGINHPEMPPQNYAPKNDWHPLRQHLLFMDDSEGLAAMVVYYHGLLAAVPSIPSEFEIVDWRPRHLPPLSSGATLSPQDGRLSLGWRPDGQGFRICRHALEITPDGVWLNGEALPSARDGDAWQVAWPLELSLHARVEGEGKHALVLRPRSYDLTRMLATVDVTWLEETDLLEAWALTVWEWQKAALLWIALKRLEGGAT